MGNIRIYQVNKDNRREFGFVDYEWFKLHGKERMERGMYDLVWDGFDGSASLEGVYERFNLHHPSDFKGHSMSVSDLVETESGLFFCDAFGFTPVEWEG